MRKFALITGGTKGIGKAVAKTLAQSGYNLVLSYGNDDISAQKTQSELSTVFPVDVFVVKADITSKTAITVIHSFLTEKNIRLSAIVLNAGITSRQTFEEIEQSEWEKIFFANIHFPVFLLQKILPLIETGGNVLFTGSLMGVYPHSVSLSYGVTKSAVHALVKNLVKFLAPYKIRVNAIAPGFVDTEWQKNKPTEIRRNIENKIAIGRFCEPHELSDVYKLIVENNYLNGEIITVSGGYSYK